jgi:hypothetical protein
MWKIFEEIFSVFVSGRTVLRRALAVLFRSDPDLQLPSSA